MAAHYLAELAQTRMMHRTGKRLNIVFSKDRFAELRAPDRVTAVWIGEDEPENPMTPDAVELIGLARNLKPMDHPAKIREPVPPPADLGKSLIQDRLAGLVGEDKSSRTLAGWSWLAVARIEVN